MDEEEGEMGKKKRKRRGRKKGKLSTFSHKVPRSIPRGHGWVIVVVVVAAVDDDDNEEEEEEEEEERSPKLEPIVPGTIDLRGGHEQTRKRKRL
jgi:hypothetical protein